MKILTALCQVYIIIPINEGPGNKRGCFKHPPLWGPGGEVDYKKLCSPFTKVVHACFNGMVNLMLIFLRCRHFHIKIVVLTDNFYTTGFLST